MKVIVDELRCDAHGVCVDACPEVFALDDDDDVVRCSSKSPTSPFGRPGPGRRGVPEGRDHDRGLAWRRDLTQALADRLAVTDVVVRYFELVDTKAWDRMHEVFTEDTTARWTPDSAREGRDGSSAATQHMIGSDEIVTFHHVATMAPVVDGDTAEVTSGCGPCTTASARGPASSTRASASSRPAGADAGGLAHQPPRVDDRGRSSASMEELFAPEIAAGKTY